MIARLAVKLRNQCNCVIAYQLGETNNSDKNGEAHILSVIAPQCNNFIDVGANVGNWTGDFLTYNNQAQGWLYEPSSQCASKLKSRFANNQITVRNVAVCDFIGQTSFVEEADCGEGSSIAGTHLLQGDFREREVEVTTLDMEFCNTNTVIDFLKIDAEGYDLKVLHGAKNLLADSRIRFVQFEYNTHWLRNGSTLHDAIEFLERHGFSCFLIRSTGLHRLDYAFWGDFFRYSNFLAVKKECLKTCEGLLSEPI